MRSFMLILLVGWQVSNCLAIDMNEVRGLFAKASADEKANDELYKLTASYSLKTYPVLYAYNAAAEMTLANHAFWPTTKYSYFSAGRDRLEEAVKSFPKNTEIRYIRYCVQQGCPFFLDYSSNLEEDKRFVLANLDKTGWSESYKSEVRDFLN